MQERVMLALLTKLVEFAPCLADKQPLVSWTPVACLLIGRLYSSGVSEAPNKLRLIGIRNGSATLVLNLLSDSLQLITCLFCSF